MHSFALLNSATSQALQAAPHPSQGASRAWSANTTQQYTTGNIVVQQSQIANFSSQNVGNPSRQMANWQSSDNSHLAAQSKNASDNFFLQLLLSQPQYKLNQLQNENIPALTTGVSQSAPMKHSHQNVTNQSLYSTIVTNATYAQQNMLVLCKPPVSFNEANRNTYSSHVQQSWTQQPMCPAANGGTTGTVSSYTAAPSLPYNQMVNAKATLTAPVQNGQNLVTPNQIHGQSFSNAGYSQNYTSGCQMASSQSSRNLNVATQRTSPDAQDVYTSKNCQINRQPSTQYSASNKNSGGFRNVNSLNQFKRNYDVIKPNENPLNQDSPIQQLSRQNLHTDGMSKSFADSAKPLPPPYESHQYTNMFRMSNQNVQTATVARSESYSLKAKSVMSKAKQGSLPIVLDVNTSENGAESGQLATINETATNGCPVDSRNQFSQGYERMLLQRGEPQAVGLSQSNKNIGMLSSFKQKDSCASSMSGHTGIRAVAVVPPLSQEDYQFPATAEPCKSVDDVEKRGISPNVTKTIEPAAVKDVSNENPVTTNKRAFNEGSQMISESEPKSLSQTSQQGNHESDVQRVSDVSVSQMGSGKQTEGTAPQLLTVHELSLLPTKSWKAEHLAKLILEMDEAQPKPKDAAGSSNIVKILITMWNKNIPAMLRSYKETLSSTFFSEIETFCETHIKEDTSIVTEVSPDFKDQLKRYTILNDQDVYSEPPYKSLWFNVNNELDDIDKEFGFPWTLKRHLYVDETESPGPDFQTIENVPEKAVNETENEVLPLAKSDSVDMTEESEAPKNLPSATYLPESTETRPYESSYSFKIEVLPPEEAKIVFEQIKQKDEHNSNIENETSVSGSEQREGSDEMDSTHAPKRKKSSDNQLEEICCLARFIEMNSGLGKPSSQCQCRDNQNENKDSIKNFKTDPELLSDQANVGCQTATVNGMKLSSQIIDLTDDSDDRLFSILDIEPEPILQTDQSNAASVSTYKDGELSADFSSSNEIHNLVFKEGKSERKHVQEELGPTGTVPSSGSVCCTQVTKLDPSNSIKTKEQTVFLNQKENCEQPPATSNDQAASSSENQAQTQVSDAANSFSLYVNNERSERKEKRQSSIRHYFQSLKKSKKRRRLVATDADHTSEAQHSASKGKKVELVLFGSGQQVSCSSFEKTLGSSQSAFYEKGRPPGVLSVKLDSLGTNIATANPTRQYSAKELIYDKWRQSIPAVNGSVDLRHKKKLKRRHSLPTLIFSRNSQGETQTVSSETSDRTKKLVLSLKKRKALKEVRRLEEMKRRRYSVALEQLEDRKASETSDEKSPQNGIVLKFSVLPNTFNLTDGSSWTKEAAESVSDELKPVEEKRLIKPAKKPKGAWYQSQAKQFDPLHISKNAGLFHEYQKKYKEKTRTSTND